MRLFLFFLSILFATLCFGQGVHDVFYTQGSKGYDLLSRSQNKVLIKNCEKVDSISNLEFSTHPDFENYLLVKKKKTLFIVNRKNGKIQKFSGVEKYFINELESNFDNNSQFTRSFITIPNNKNLIFIDLERHSIFTIDRPNSSALVLEKDSLFKIAWLSDSGLGFKVQIIDFNGKQITRPYYQSNFTSFEKGFIASDFSQPDSFKLGVGIVNKKGEFIYDPVNVSIKPVLNKYLIVMNEQSRIGLLNFDLDTIVPFQYESIVEGSWMHESVKVSSEGVFAFYKNWKKKEIVFHDSQGKIVEKDSTYKIVESLDEPWGILNRYWRVSDSSQYIFGIYDTKKKKEVFQQEYKFPKKHFELRINLMGAFKNGKYGVLDLENENIPIPFEYDKEGYHFEERDNGLTYFLLQKNGVGGILNVKGDVLLSFDYDYFTFDKSREFLIVKKDGLFGLLNANSLEEVLPIEYRVIRKDLTLELKENGGVQIGEFYQGKIIWKR